MLILLSPSKTLDMTPSPIQGKPGEPVLLDETKTLVKRLKSMKKSELAKLMNISDKLAELNYARYQSFTTPFSANNAKQAIRLFKGDVYDGLDAASLSSGELTYAHKHLRILSGLYGVIRPLDYIHPYRLEMGIKLDNPRGKNLYHFWEDRISKQLNQDIERHKDHTIINLASNEYSKAVDRKALTSPLLTVNFKEYRDGNYKTIGLFAKKARGMMARYIVQNSVETPEGLKNFTDGGYTFKPSLSTKNEWVFAR